MAQVANISHEKLEGHPSRNRDATPFPLSAFDTKSFAYYTIQTRLPIILTKIVDHLSRYKSEVYDEKDGEDVLHAHHGSPQGAWNIRRQEVEEDLKAVLGALAKLRNELQTNKTMTPFPSSRNLTPTSTAVGEFITEDLEEWNFAFSTELAQNVVNPETSPKWFEVSFLFAECYLYRRIMLAIQETTHLKRLDPFKWQKADSLRDSTQTVHLLLDNLSTIMAKAIASEETSPEIFKNYFHQFFRLSLWGNKGDLSLTAGKGEVKFETFDSETHRKMGDAILVDDSEEVWAHLLACHQGQSRGGHVRVDLICDNYGQELVTDLIFGEFLLASKLATQVCYHVKGLPWFVSDTTIPDFLRMLDIIDDHNGKYGQKWRNYLMNGKFVLTTDPFWTLPYDFDYMQSRAPKLYSYLQQSSLIVVKGDLNYRKLTGDLKWPHTTPFRTALRSFHPAPLCTLRGLKAEVVVGLSEGQAETVYRQAHDWLTSGHFNVIQFAHSSW